MNTRINYYLHFLFFACLHEHSLYILRGQAAYPLKDIMEPFEFDNIISGDTSK